jgi:hypothetical protein
MLRERPTPAAGRSGIAGLAAFAAEFLLTERSPAYFTFLKTFRAVTQTWICSAFGGLPFCSSLQRSQG